MSGDGRPPKLTTSGTGTNTQQSDAPNVSHQGNPGADGCQAPDNGVFVPLEVVRESDPTDVREGSARRNLVITTGRCPCGAVAKVPNRAARRRGGALLVMVGHRRGCPAATTWRGAR